MDDVRQSLLGHQQTIPDEYLDGMGHMNVMWYTHLFSQGNHGLLKRIGIDAKNPTNGSGSFVMENHFWYLSEVHAGQTVSIFARVLERDVKRFFGCSVMVNETTNRIAAIMRGASSHVDLQTRRSAPFPAEIADALDILIQQQKRLDWPVPDIANG
ncbi:MAG: thioesterase family protein, partial [Planctomycetota bacterium]